MSGIDAGCGASVPPTRRGPITFITMHDHEKLEGWRQAQRKVPLVLLSRAREAIPSSYHPPTPNDRGRETIHLEPHSNDS